MFLMSLLKAEFSSKYISICESRVKEDFLINLELRGIQLFHH